MHLCVLWIVGHFSSCCLSHLYTFAQWTPKAIIIIHRVSCPTSLCTFGNIWCAVMLVNRMLIIYPFAQKKHKTIDQTKAGTCSLANKVIFMFYVWGKGSLFMKLQEGFFSTTLHLWWENKKKIISKCFSSLPFMGLLYTNVMDILFLP